MQPLAVFIASFITLPVGVGSNSSIVVFPSKLELIIVLLILKEIVERYSCVVKQLALHRKFK